MFEDDVCLKCRASIQNIRHFTLKCFHKFCAECLCKHLQKFTSDITCPCEGCDGLIKDSIIRECLPSDQVDLYDKFCYPPDSIKCLIPDCPYLVVSNSTGFFECPICKQPNCISCNNLHEKDKSCNVLHRKKEYELKASNILREKNRLRLINLAKIQKVCKNTEMATCPCCGQFILPREGIETILCGHISCRSCFRIHLEGAANSYDLTCMECSQPLERGECLEFMKENKFEEICFESVKHRFYQCQYPKCEYYWFVDNFKGSAKCPLCKKTTCFSCETIHNGESCNTYKKSSEYKKRQEEKKIVASLKSITCYNCKNEEVKGEGCGAIQCKICKKRICAFYGSKLGRDGCKCTSLKPCHIDCKHGCVPEGHSTEEEEVRNYFNGK